MSSGTELLWPGAALLVLLGVAASLCVRCSRPVVGQAWPGPLEDTALTRKDKLLQFSPGLEDPASSRYQNFSKGSRHGLEEGYIDPIAMEYYNWGRFRKPPEDDANSYENVLICKQKTTEPVAQQDGTGGLCRGDHILSPALKTGSTSDLCPAASPEDDEESEDYQNSASIHQWRESRRVMGQLQRQVSPGPVGSPDEEDDGEPDYVNGEVSATEA
ncbi:linker for activation of T-cells family member 2 isoform X2 [Piliocolobus tephrosceles]|uniref:linker for activation of T-cells family member 2 isoform X2 n=1 Tax=Piliocolobus tephrosceles TaxID=591936 RepID=UPI000E6AEE41|nr:linker for activation of T-cells family member 2 isoform X2 [Piliocolobus tephrosceles]